MDRVKQLISAGTDLNFVIHRGGNSPLTLAICTQRYDIALELIAAGADVTIAEATQWRRQPIHLAAAAGALDVTSAILAQCPAMLTAVDAMLFTPLHHASIAGHVELVSVLVSSGAHVDSHDDRGRTPLFRAVKHGHVNIVDMLLGAGADVNTVDSFGWTPIYQSTLCGQVNMVEHLLHCGAKISIAGIPGHVAGVGIPLHAAAGGATPTVFIKLREVGVEFYGRQRLSTTQCVHQATSYSLQTGELVTQLTQLLLDFGADVNERDTDMLTTVYHAVRSGRRDVVRLLLSAGARLFCEQWIIEQRWPASDVGVIDRGLCDWLHRVATSGPLLLAALCRLTVRQSVHPPISKSLLCLPLPQQVINFLHLSIMS